MSIDLERELGKFKDDLAQAELAKLGITWSKAWRKLHGSLPIVTAPPVNAETTQKTKDLLAGAILEYKRGPLTPELVTSTWQTAWKVWGDSVEHTFDVPYCDRTSEELAALKSEGRGVVLTPDEIYTPEGLILLGRIFPRMRSWSTEAGTTVTNEVSNGGSIDIEMSVDAPYRTAQGYTEQELIDKIASDARQGQRLATYIVGSQFSKLLTGKYFDQGDTWSRLPGSRGGDGVLGAYFYSDGYLSVRFWRREFQFPDLGGRSEGVKKA